VTVGEAARRGRATGLVFVLVWLSCAWFGSWEWNPNNAVRLFAAVSLVEEQSATIDRFEGLTIDKARFGDHYYSDKAPGMTLMALPAVAVADVATGQTARDISFSWGDAVAERFLKLRLRTAAATTSAVLTAIAAVLIFALATSLGGSMGAGVFAALAFALGTPMWGWSTTIFGHAPVAALFVVAIWAAWRGTAGARPAPTHAVVLGAALGWSVVIEYSALLNGAAIGLFALWRLRRWSLAEARPALIAAALPALGAAAILVGYNLFAFGTPFRLGYQGVVGFAGMNEGVFGLTYPRPDRLWELTLGTRRGLIWCAPVAVIGLAGLVRLFQAHETRALAVMAFTGALVVLLYNAAYAYWDGGNSTGPRHLVPALAYLAVGFGPAWTWVRGAAWRDALVTVLGASIAINLVIASAEIATGGQGDFPLWSDVFETRFLMGQLRTVPNEWFGWSAYGGLALYLAIASALGAALVSTVRGARAPA
jgi:hypothetical protein